MIHSLLIYGANGYTGRLICERAALLGLKPILAGRNGEEIRELALTYGWEYRVFGLDTHEAVAEKIHDVKVVLHAAGPFMYTAKPMMEACLLAGVHYLDITGEIAVFEMAARRDERAKAAGILLMPGTGFDVVPTDCLALYLKQQMPDATRLQLAFVGQGGGVSRGTAGTMVEGLGKGGAVRVNGQLQHANFGQNSLTVPHPAKTFFAISIPWGDITTAYHTTGIPNIETYMGFSRRMYGWIKLMPYFKWLFSKLEKIYQKAQRATGRGLLHSSEPTAEAWSGAACSTTMEPPQAWLITKDGYTLTAITSLMIAQRVLQGDVKPGFHTPAGLYGADLIMEVEGSERG
ncbi:MAG: saccharopine dehydrogenase NADP-binding domain-containing protein [Saprospiraceae bacterium]|nr:saccharopine dehydrogenase NADP-binding domain-containing protein [Saprospiraceae bacterium]